MLEQNSGGSNDALRSAQPGAQLLKPAEAAASPGAAGHLRKGRAG